MAVAENDPMWKTDPAGANGAAGAYPGGTPQPGAAWPPPFIPEKPVRRVGSWTLGLALIICGVCFLLYYFVPGFNFLLAAKLSPVFLVLLGIEVVFYSLRPGRGKYDFLSVLACLFIMGCCFCLTLVPVLWQYLGPERHTAEQSLAAQAEAQLYQRLKGGDVSDLDVRIDLNWENGALPQQLSELKDSDDLWMEVTLSGSYATPLEFAAACRPVLSAVRAEGLKPTHVKLLCGQADDSGGSLYVNSLYEMDWTAEQLAAQVQWTEPEPEPLDGEGADAAAQADNEALLADGEPAAQAA